VTGGASAFRSVNLGAAFWISGEDCRLNPAKLSHVRGQCAQLSVYQPGSRHPRAWDAAANYDFERLIIRRVDEFWPRQRWPAPAFANLAVAHSAVDQIKPFARRPTHRGLRASRILAEEPEDQ
jgi:hypothetical protein